MTNPSKTTIALLGVGGYGRIYVSPLLNDAMAGRHGVELIAGVEPNPAAGPSLDAVNAHGIPVYSTSAELYAKHRPDVVVIASPIHFHCQQTIEALQHGAHVLCEKPLAATPQQGEAMMAAETESGRQVAIGYQWSFCPSIQRLKADVLSGAFGRPRRCKSLTLWPRDEVYYTRNGWAGRRTTRGGLPVHDSPINNACAHFLHNLLYLLGPAAHLSAAPQSVTGELYRANDIETFDTAALRVRLAGDVELLMITSHATAQTFEPVFELRFDRAVVRYNASEGGRLTATFDDGVTLDYGAPASSSSVDKLWAAVDAFRTGRPVPCGIDAAMPQAVVVSAAEASMPDAIDFPRSLVHVQGEPGSRTTRVAGLGEVLIDCYQHWQLPSETGVAWTERGREIVLKDAATAESDASGFARSPRPMHATVLAMTPSVPPASPN